MRRPLHRTRTLTNPPRAGTDATIAEHISKIIDREYVIKQKEGSVEYLVPSTLGIGLVKAYDALGLENSLSKPHLRRLVRSLVRHSPDETHSRFRRRKNGSSRFARARRTRRT